MRFFNWIHYLRPKEDPGRLSLKQLVIPLMLGMLFLQACSTIAEVAGTFNTTPSQVPAQTTATGLPFEPTSTSTQKPVSRSTLIPTFTPSPVLTQTPTLTPTSTPLLPVVFAAIGDYGNGQESEADVAKLVESWNPEFIITLGDNNYPNGSGDRIDEVIGQFYHSFIFPYAGSYGDGADINRFFPALGNHDTLTEHGKPYLDYFTLPGNERYYDYVWGYVHLYALDDLSSEPGGGGVKSAQAEWLKKSLAESTSPWSIVYRHYPPFSSGLHGSTNWAQWPYAEWGADAVLSGHDHTYERFLIGGLTYITNGLGGASIYDFTTVLEGSQLHYNADYGALRIEATDHSLLFQFINRGGEVIDSYEIDQ